MAKNNDSVVGDVGKGVLGIGVGFALYFLIRNFRFGGGFGIGGGAGDREEGRGTGGPSIPVGPEPLPKDVEPLLFVVFHPPGLKDTDDRAADVATRARREAAFHRIDLGTEEIRPRAIYRRAGAAITNKSLKPLSLDDVIARVKAGGRDDVRLINMGSIRSGTWGDVLDALMGGGIKHWTLWEQAPADRQPSGRRPAEPYKGPTWALHNKHHSVGNPDKKGHYLFDNVGTAYWNLDRSLDPADAPPKVSGNTRGYYGRASR